MFSQVELELFGDVLVAIRIDLSAGPRPRWNSSENRAQPVQR